jgi:hypothetical protein
MATIQVGVGRIYNALGCEVENSEKVDMKFVFDRLEVYATLGPDLRHIILTSTIAPPKPIGVGEGEYQTRVLPRKFPSTDIFPADQYFEIEVVDTLEIEEELNTRVRDGDIPARDIVFSMINERKDRYKSALDFIGGMLGLKLHYMLVRQLIIEQRYIYLGKRGQALSNNMSLSILPIYKINLNSDYWKANLTPQFQKAIGNANIEAMGQTLAWLIRGWSADDLILKFVCFFTALERVIPAAPHMTALWSERRDKVLEELKVHRSTAWSEDIFAFIDELRPPPISIVDRFKSWAGSVRIKGWELDIYGFRKFLRMRNLLLHRGEDRIDFKVRLDEEDLRYIEDMAERYVSLSLFGDAEVYPSKERPTN